MCGGVHYGEVEGLVSVGRWSCSRGEATLLYNRPLIYLVTVWWSTLLGG